MTMNVAIMLCVALVAAGGGVWLLARLRSRPTPQSHAASSSLRLVALGNQVIVIVIVISPAR